MEILKTEEAGEELSFRKAILPPELRELRQRLGQKAKQQKCDRFHSLYGLGYRKEVLQAAWAAVKRNDGAPGRWREHRPDRGHARKGGGVSGRDRTELAVIFMVVLPVEVR